MPKIDVLMYGSGVNTDVGIIGFCTVVLVEGEKRVLFDSAHGGRRTYLLEQFRSRGLTPDDVDVQVLSHAHWDHIQNLDVCEKAPILVHPLERAYAQHPDPNDWATPKYTGAVLESIEVQEAGEGYEIMPGCRVIDLPGHSPGSIGLEVETDDGVCIIAGDAIHNGPVAQLGRSPLVFSDSKKADASIKRCVDTGALIYPGHDLPFRLHDGELQYEGKFHIGLTGVTPDTPGVQFLSTGPQYTAGGPEGWKNGNGQRWIMPGVK